jgi:predicted Zn-dependent protease with MMP-like domain/Flp pilus assembly protein TadD
MEAAHDALRQDRPREAWACADHAVDLDPRSVEAHHLRAEALLAQGMAREAELGFQLALALSPDDVHTLHAVADYYLSWREPRDRSSVQLALALAERGLEVVRRRPPASPALHAQLLLIAAAAHVDLEAADRGAAEAAQALLLEPLVEGGPAILGVAQFHLGEFAKARASFERALATDPDDASSHYYLGLTFEWLDEPALAAHELLRATALDPVRFPRPTSLSEEALRQEVAAVLSTLPAALQAQLQAVEIAIVDRPSLDDLRAVTPPFPPTILGLYRGLPITAPDAGESPRSIALYRLNLERIATSLEDLRTQLRTTLLHEIGHFQGHDDDDLRRRGME